MHRLPLLPPRVFLLLLLVVLGPPNAAADPMTWVNAVRRAVRVQPVQEDLLLSRTAGLWAARCAAAGLISHRGDDGSTALDRYRSLGGTEISVGEILGAGPDAARVEKGWMTSDEHRRLALSPGWTHAGWGSAQSGTSQVIVMLFTRKLVERLVITGGPGGLVVTGAYLPQDAARGALYDGLDEVAPSTWEPAGRAFRFDLPTVLIARYIRLGYVTAGGKFTLTNAFTWPPGTESPGEPGRFAPPAPSP